jgi:hypothetical protein
MDAQTANWAEIARLLREARADLSSVSGPAAGVPDGPLRGSLAEFAEFLDHNELELAWDSLAAIAERIAASVAFWRRMARAAALMQLRDRQELADRHVTPAVTFERALGIAQSDAEKVYRNLLYYRVSIVLGEDGCWHVDYELADPRVQGGGPRYVIDATTGAILSKNYYQ